MGRGGPGAQPRGWKRLGGRFEFSLMGTTQKAKIEIRNEAQDDPRVLKMEAHNDSPSPDKLCACRKG